MGAALGTVLLPGIGSAAGYFVGKLLGDNWNVESAKQLYRSVCEYFDELGEKTWDCLVADVSDAGEQVPPLLAGIFDAVEQERGRLERAVRERIDECEGNIGASRSEAKATVTRACEAWEWNQAFRNRQSVQPFGAS